MSEGTKSGDTARTGEEAVDLLTTAGKLADFRRRNDEAVHAGSTRAVEAQHARGKQTARERVLQLLDEGRQSVTLADLSRKFPNNGFIPGIRHPMGGFLSTLAED